MGPVFESYAQKVYTRDMQLLPCDDLHYYHSIVLNHLHFIAFIFIFAIVFDYFCLYYIFVVESCLVYCQFCISYYYITLYLHLGV